MLLLREICWSTAFRRNLRSNHRLNAELQRRLRCSRVTDVVNAVARYVCHGGGPGATPRHGIQSGFFTSKSLNSRATLGNQDDRVAPRLTVVRTVEITPSCILNAGGLIPSIRSWIGCLVSENGFLGVRATY
jgi:hypothetical protein